MPRWIGYGGYGFTARMWGLTLDNILSINVVLADGSIKTASSSSNSNLFWVSFRIFSSIISHRETWLPGFAGRRRFIRYHHFNHVQNLPCSRIRNYSRI